MVATASRLRTMRPPAHYAWMTGKRKIMGQLTVTGLCAHCQNLIFQKRTPFPSRFLGKGPERKRNIVHAEVRLRC